MHGPEPEIGRSRRLARGLSAIVAVGLRPCSGAILVLFRTGAGVVLGRRPSSWHSAPRLVTVIATIAVAAKSLAKRYTIARGGTLVMPGIEVGAPWSCW